MTKTSIEAFFRCGQFTYRPEVKDEYLELLTRIHQRIRHIPGILVFKGQLTLLGFFPKVAAQVDKYEMRAIIQGFQSCFRPEKADGIIDIETCAIFYAVVDQYLINKNKKSK